ncbi:MAG TPA: hypothetical protein VH590_12625 [Ktedonobacterales bacterium]|jgi:hypothetical protein
MMTLRYHLKLLNYDYLLITGIVWALGAFLTWFTYHSFNQGDMTISILELVFPVPVAVLASAAFAGDPAREVVCATERPVWQIVASRVAVVLGLLVVMAVLFDGYLAVLHVPLPGDGGWLEQQLVWLSPSLVLIFAALLASLWSRSATVGAAVAVGVWLLEIVLHSLLVDDVVLQGFWLDASQRSFLFATLWEKGAPYWLVNREVLIGIAAALALACLWRMSRTEWLLGGD